MTGDKAYDKPMEGYEPICLGGFCETKFQLVRKLYFQEHPNKTPLSLRGMMSMPGKGEQKYGWGPFCWQGTPTDALLHCLEHDFAGCFEREDIGLETEGGHQDIVHKTLRTLHLHDFEQGRHWTEERLDEVYPRVRSLFERRAQKFRDLLLTPGPYLYVHLTAAMPTPDQIHRLVKTLGARSAYHRFKVLFMAPDADQADLSAFGGQVCAAVRSGTPGGEDGRWSWWSSYDHEWDAALAPFDIRLHGATAVFAPQAAPSAPPAVTQTTAKPAGRPFSRLFNR